MHPLLHLFSNRRNHNGGQLYFKIWLLMRGGITICIAVRHYLGFTTSEASKKLASTSMRAQTFVSPGREH